MPPGLGPLKNTVIVVIGCCQEERAVSPGWGTAEKYSHCGHWLPPVGEKSSPLDGEQLKNSHCGHWPPPAGEELCLVDWDS